MLRFLFFISIINVLYYLSILSYNTGHSRLCENVKAGTEHFYVEFFVEIIPVSFVLSAILRWTARHVKQDHNK